MNTINKLVDLQFIAARGPCPYPSQHAIDSIKQLTAKIVSSRDVKCTIHLMKKLRKLVYSEFPPETLTLCMNDFMTDEGMWQWADNLNIVTKHDFEAVYWIVSSMSEIVSANKILEKQNVC